MRIKEGKQVKQAILRWDLHVELLDLPWNRVDDVLRLLHLICLVLVLYFWFRTICFSLSFFFFVEAFHFWIVAAEADLLEVLH